MMPQNERNAVHDILASMSLFEGIEAGDLRDLAAHSEMVEVQRGDLVIHEGEPPDYFYVVVRGSLEVFSESRAGSGEAATVIDMLQDGDCVGEMGVLLQQPRTASARAHRDSLLIQVSGECFEQLLHRNAELTLRLARTLSERLKRTTISTTRKIPLKIIALYRCCDQALFEDFCRRLASEFEAAGKRVQLLSPPNHQDTNPPISLRDEELLNDYVLCACTEDTPEWTTRNARQADLILCVGSFATAPLRALPDGIEAARSKGAHIELALLRKSGTLPRGTKDWLRNIQFDAHHHVSVDNKADYTRLFRRFSGSAWGLVLGGGGARGLAHIGAIRALQENSIPIDMIAGTSMGAIVAAQYAMGFSPADMLAMTRKAYVGGSDWADLTFPFVSLRTGRGTTARLEEMFGDVQIEDLPTGYFCVSCNLTRATSMIHDHGPVARWVRVSCSVPGLLPPVPWKGDLLVDGAMLNNLPVDEMRKRVRGLVAAADVSVEVDLAVDPSLPPSTSWSARSQLMRKLARRPRLPTIVPLLMRTAEISSVRDSKISGTPADLYLHLPVDEYAMTDFNSIDRIVESGYEYTMRILQNIKNGPGSDALNHF